MDGITGKLAEGVGVALGFASVWLVYYGIKAVVKRVRVEKSR